MGDFIVPRPAMAARIADMLTPDPISGALSGLFLAAPRRTGKSTFLRRDLVPALTARGMTVLYVDLWSDRSADPASLIMETIQSAIDGNAGAIEKWRKRTPFDRIGVLGFSLGLRDRDGGQKTASSAFQILTASTGRDIALIVDEAQQALATAAGLDAMFALKAARDAVNQAAGGGRLYLVMTGSHRDKLAALVHDQKSPFFGAQIRDFPPLGREFSEAVANRVNANLAPHLRLETDLVDRAFETLGRKPELLLDCLRELITSDGQGAQALLDVVERKRQAIEASRLGEILALSALQQAVLRLLIGDGPSFTPFASATRDRLKAGAGGRAPSVGAIQKALDVLRDKGFIWRSGHGVYALENLEIAGALKTAPRS